MIRGMERWIEESIPKVMWNVVSTTISIYRLGVSVALQLGGEPILVSPERRGDPGKIT